MMISNGLLTFFLSKNVCMQT